MNSNESFSEKLFWMYALAAVNLYGAITVKSFVEFVAFYEEPGFVTEDFCCKQFEPFSDFYLKDSIPEEFNDIYYNRNRKILMSFDLLDERCSQCEKATCEHCRIEPGTAVRMLLDRQNLHNRYLPSKFEVLKYSDRFYEAPSSEKSRLTDYILDLTKDEVMTEDIVNEVSWGIRVTGVPSEYFQIYSEKGVFQKLNPKQLKQLIDMTIRLHNVTHAWYLNGNSPSGLKQA